MTTSRDQSHSFVSLNDSVAVLSDRSVPPRLVGQINVGGSPAGVTLTHDGRYLLVASGSGAVVLDARLAAAVDGHSVVATLSSPGSGAIEVAVSNDDRYAFVTLEKSDEMAVFDLRRSLSGHASGSGLVGMVPLGRAPVGMALSPDGQWLYATSEAMPGSAANAPGTLSVIDVARAETSPRNAVMATVAAGCSPVRVAVSSDGATIWVTARGSDALLGFSAAKLAMDPRHAEIAAVAVGTAPVGLAVVDDDRRVVVADSNRFGAHVPASDLAVVDSQAALAGRPALLGYIPAGRFPRDVAVIPGRNALLVTNYASEQLEDVSLDDLP